MLDLNFGDFFATNQLALVLTEQKAKLQRAMQYAEVNARSYPRSAEAAATYGWVNYKSGKLDEAERILGAATSSGQASADTAYYLAKVLYDRAKYTEAQEILKKALDNKGVFVNRKDAEDFMVEVAKQAKAHPKVEKETKKEDGKLSP